MDSDASDLQEIKGVGQSLCFDIYILYIVPADIVIYLSLVYEWRFLKGLQLQPIFLSMKIVHNSTLSKQAQKGLHFYITVAIRFKLCRIVMKHYNFTSNSMIISLNIKIKVQLAKSNINLKTQTN